MKKYIFNSLIIASIALFFVSCENIIEFNGEVTQPLLVVNSFCTPDSVVKVHVSKSRFFLEDNYSFDMVNNATVYLWINGVKKEKLVSTGNGYYTGTYKPAVDETVKITASTNEFAEVSGSDIIPKPAKVLSVDTTRLNLESTPILDYTNNYLKPDTLGEIKHTQLNFSVQIDDPANTPNYYRLQVKLRTIFADESYRDNIFYINSDDLVFKRSDEGSIFDDGGYNYYYEFSDDLFEGKKYYLKFYTNFQEFVYFNSENKPPVNKTGTQTGERYQMIINLQSITKPYYMYIKTITANYSVSEFFSEPVQIFSNVDGGIGVIGSYTSNILKVDLPYLPDFGYYNNYSGKE